MRERWELIVAERPGRPAGCCFTHFIQNTSCFSFHSVQQFALPSKPQSKIKLISLILFVDLLFAGQAAFTRSIWLISLLSINNGLRSRWLRKKSIHSSTIPLLKNGCFLEFANYCYNIILIPSNQFQQLIERNENKKIYLFVWMKWKRLMELWMLPPS